MKRKLVVLIASTALLAAACGGSDHSQHEGGGSADSSEQEDPSGFGRSGDSLQADETVKVLALDKLAFDPPDITVQAGDTVRFVVTNKGKAPHEFVIGDQAYQDEHEKAMEHGGAHDDDLGNVVELRPGETSELTWTFTTAGEVLYACHVAGHYAGGMFGTVTVVE